MPTRCARSSMTIRSEEHTSELQSRGLISYAVFCLKKKDQISTLATSPKYIGQDASPDDVRARRVCVGVVLCVSHLGPFSFRVCSIFFFFFYAAAPPLLLPFPQTPPSSD